jgi:hypothetical protein
MSAEHVNSDEPNFNILLVVKISRQVNSRLRNQGLATAACGRFDCSD